MRRAAITSDDIDRWKQQGLGLGHGASYKPWIDVRCFSSRGRMSRRPGITTGRMHHLFSDNEDFFFLMADFAASVVDIREQFPLLPETSTQELARALGVKHPRYPRTKTPVVMTTDFLLTVLDGSGRRSFAAWSIKSVDELRGRSKRSVLAKLELERRFWLGKQVPWRLFTSEDFNQVVIDNLDWLNYLTVDYEPKDEGFLELIPAFLNAFASSLAREVPLKEQLQGCASVIGIGVNLSLSLELFRYCVWHHLIDLELRVPVGLQLVPIVRSVQAISGAVS
jgi:TnsA endonuclease N terminal